eukprot:196131_1
MSSNKNKRSYTDMKGDENESSTSNSMLPKPKSKKRKLNKQESQKKNKKSKSKSKKKKKAPKKRGAIPGVCTYQTKKDIGDALKSLVSLEKWTIPAKCLQVRMDCVAFNHLFGEHGDITPPQYDEDTPCVVCRLDGDNAGNVFGKTKCRGGSRMGTFEIEKMDVVFLPSQRSARIWFAVGEEW